MKVAQMMIKRVLLIVIATVINSLSFFGSFVLYLLHFSPFFCESIYH
jgi:hypothetical protein